ncbi:carbohydrate ABC transporter permease [Streptomyces sp. TR02-1]|uniref:carbohydrate ABC transporter permease n=1 Tax=Streptomyces sp. TR02-1 TaxID=3385977 RepID=UPI0039A2B602
MAATTASSGSSGGPGTSGAVAGTPTPATAPDGRRKDLPDGPSQDGGRPSGRGTGGRRARRGDRLSRQTGSGWLFSAPFLALFATFMAFPILATLTMSFTDFGLRNVTDPLSAEFVGLANYTELFGDEKFLTSLFNTIYFVALGVPLTVGTGLGAAVLLNSGIDRMRTFFRVGFYAPVVTSIVAVAVVWRFVLDPVDGLIAGLAEEIGLQGPDFLGSSTLAMPSLIVMAAWRNMGTAMVLFLAGLQSIPIEVREASRIDGAGLWQEFRRITVPLLRPTMLYVSVMTTISFLNVFEEPFVMTQGGPNDSTLTVSLHMYKEGFNFFHMGYASSMAYVLFTVILAVTLLQLRLLKDRTT